MKRIKQTAVLAVILLSASMFSGCGMLYTGGVSAVQVSYDNPHWAPPYYPGARYYYLPDIETYYDLSTRDFIFLDHGRWVYSRTLPSFYADFDLDNCFSIVLNLNVYRPWMHHQYYVAHYPRYYYRDYYDHSNIPYVRGYNENRRSAIYWGPNERNRARSWDDQNLRNERKFKYQKEDRQEQKRTYDQYYERSSSGKNVPQRGSDKYAEPAKNTGSDTRSGRDANTTVTRQPKTAPASSQQPERASESTRQQSTNYYGRTIGNPVKVQKQMKEERKPSTPREKSGGRR